MQHVWPAGEVLVGYMRRYYMHTCVYIYEYIVCVYISMVICDDKALQLVVRVFCSLKKGHCFVEKVGIL